MEYSKLFGNTLFKPQNQRTIIPEIIQQIIIYGHQKKFRTVKNVLASIPTQFCMGNYWKSSIYYYI